MKKIEKLENGKFIFDFDKYFSLPEAIKGQLHEEGDLSDEAILKLITYCYGTREDNPSFTDKQWKKYLNQWIEDVRNYKPSEKCICQEVHEWSGGIRVGEGGRYTCISMNSSIDNQTGKRSYYLEASGDDQDFLSIRYCPICGRKLW